MSSSFRSRTALAAAFVFAVAVADQAIAQSYFIPRVEVSSEYHTNRELAPLPGQADPTTGYIATAQALMGKRTPRSQTELRPRVRLQEYPDRRGVDPLDLFLDLQTDYRTLGGSYSLLASASKQDTFNAEYGEAGRDTTGPATPPSHGDTGIVFLGNTRTEFQLEPSMYQQISERSSLGATLGYDKVNYQDNAVFAREDYTDAYLATLLKHQIRPLTQFEIGPYVSRYEAAHNANRTDGAGITFGWNHDVSEVSHTKLDAQVERTKIEDPALFSGTETQTNWGAEFSGYRRAPVSRLDYAVGRYLGASGIGSKTERSELRLQYSREFSPRFGFKGAVRGGTEKRLGLSDSSRDRKYVRTELTLRWSVTRTMYVSGGYRYAWQKFKSNTNDADDNAAFILLGFSGLDVRRSAVRGAQ